MLLFIVPFLFSLFINFVLIRFKDLHQHLSGDAELDGPQKFHTSVIPRIGGLGIYIGLWAAALVAFYASVDLAEIIMFIFISAFPVFFMGVLEDLTKQVGVKNRLYSAIASSVILLYLFDISFIHVDILWVDHLLTNKWAAYIFIVFSCAGLSNAYNIIDGFNGLSSMVAMIALTSITVVAYIVNDTIVVYLGLICLGSISGFFIWNFPKGRIFLGDGGAYLIGFLIAAISILLSIRNLNISPWFVFLVNIYPIFETLFTIWRRLINRGMNPSIPDGLHLHSLIFRRKIRWVRSESKKIHNESIRNSKTSLYLWALSLLGAIPAVAFWHSTSSLIISVFLYAIIYVYIYRNIVKFKKLMWL